ncbi:hypothetical protein [Croceibacterium aestuarii]|uniref:hypothetical protein n=1 Tax=Croceibacterium aestuarii TaxID=3064139 RepID=UPI00272E72B1|nr:hypothetical protein [Croceibacterium sp. D39]
MRRALFLALLLLPGCTTMPGAAEPAPQPAPSPEPVACVDRAQIPAEPPMVGERFNGDAKHDLQILAPNAQALRKWGEDLRALLETCAAAGPPPAPAAPAAGATPSAS